MSDGFTPFFPNTSRKYPLAFVYVVQAGVGFEAFTEGVADLLIQYLAKLPAALRTEGAGPWKTTIPRFLKADRIDLRKYPRLAGEALELAGTHWPGAADIPLLTGKF